MQKSHAFFIVILIPAVLFATYMILTSPSQCDTMYENIERAMEEANHCETDADCTTLMLGGEYIEFGCYHYINKNEPKDPFYTMMEEYNQKCTKMINECAPVPDAICKNSKCV